MKKLLLSLSALTLAFSASAQTDCWSATGFNDHFTSATAPGTWPSSLVYWGEPTIYSQTRSGNGYLELEVTQAEGGWTPMGFDIGSIDITANKTLSASFTNNGASGVEIYFDLLSGLAADGKMISGTSTGAPFGGAVAAGQTKTFTFDLTGAQKRTWVADKAACDALGGTLKGASSCMQDKSFDFAAVSTIEFSINGEATQASGWKQPAITAHPVKIDFITFGTSCSPESVSDVAAASFKVSTANGAITLTNLVGASSVTVVDLAGNTVGSQAVNGSSSASISTANLAAGVYVVSVQTADGVATQKVVLQ